MPIQWDGEVQKKEGGAKRGTGIGLYGTRKRMFKGHKWERVMAARIETRKSLMGKMKNRIMRFKQVSMCPVLHLDMQAHFVISSIITGDVQIRSDPPGLRSHRSYPSREWTLSGCISFFVW